MKFSEPPWQWNESDVNSSNLKCPLRPINGLSDGNFKKAILATFEKLNIWLIALVFYPYNDRIFAKIALLPRLYFCAHIRNWSHCQCVWNSELHFASFFQGHPAWPYLTRSNTRRIWPNIYVFLQVEKGKGTRVIY